MDEDSVRELGIFINSLIQKYNIIRFVTAYICMCILVTNAAACRDDIQMNTVKAQIIVIRKIILYPVEGSMPRASEAPFTDHSRCRTMFVVQSHERITRKKTP
jgi:hypothetical protein